MKEKGVKLIAIIVFLIGYAILVAGLTAGCCKKINDEKINALLVNHFDNNTTIESSSEEMRELSKLNNAWLEYKQYIINENKDHIMLNAE